MAAACPSSSCRDTSAARAVSRPRANGQRTPSASSLMTSSRCDTYRIEFQLDGHAGVSRAAQFFPAPRLTAPQPLLLILLLLTPPLQFLGLWEDRCQPHSPGSKNVLPSHETHGTMASVLMQARSSGRTSVQSYIISATNTQASSLALERRWRRRRVGLMLAAALSPASSSGQGGGTAAGAASAAGSTISNLLPGVDKGSLLMRPSFDASLDWASNVTAKGVGGCTLAKDAASPTFMPRRCPKPRRPVGIDEARKLGWKFAPLLHQHSLDWSRLSDPGAWLASAVLVDPVTYTTIDLKTYLENRHLARRAKTEKAAAEATAAAASAAAASGDSDAQAKAAETAAAKAAAAAAEAAAADPYWLIHEAYNTHNFFATRLVRRRYGSAPPKAAAVTSPPVAHGHDTQQQQTRQPEVAEATPMSATDPNGLQHSNGQQQPQPTQAQQQQAVAGRRMMEGVGSCARSQQQQRLRRQQQEVEMEVDELGLEGGEVAPGAGEGKSSGSGMTADGGQEEQEAPYWPHFEALQGEEFFEAIAGDPLVGEGEEKEDGTGEAGGPGWRRQQRAAAEGGGTSYSSSASAGSRGGKKQARLGGNVYFTVFEPRLEHLHWTRPRPHTTSSPSDDLGPFTASWEATSKEPTYAYVYTFWFFYPFNGCSNQLMATRFAGRHQAAEYFLCPLGVHEGDWEHLKVYVCQDGMFDEHEPARAITALQYSQHTWLPTYDCVNGSWPGDCSFEPDPDTGQLRPRVYSGLHSHANSPHTSNLNVYAKVNFKQLLNFDGIYVADRFAAGGPLFVPSTANTLWLPFPHEMGKEEGVRPEDFRPGGALAWTAYLGNWGVPLTSPNFSITCLTHNLSMAGPCDPRNPPVFILDRLLGGVGARPLDVTWTPVLSPKRVAPELAEPISGPLVRRAASYSWERELPAPLWDAREPLPGLGGLSLATLARDTSSLACPLAEDVHRTSAWGPAGHYLGNDPRVVHRLRLFVAAATTAIVAAAALSALVVKCMPLILAPHHKPPHHHHHHHGYGHYGYGGHNHGYGAYGNGHGDSRGTVGEPYDESYCAATSQVGSPPLLGFPHTFRLVYGGHNNSLLEPLAQQEDSLYDGATSEPYRHQHQQQSQRGGATAPVHQQWDARGAARGGVAGGCGGGSGRSSSEAYSSFNSSATASEDEGPAAAPPLQGPDGRLVSYDSRTRGLSHDIPAAKLLCHGTSTNGLSAGPQAAAARFSEDGGGGSGDTAAVTAVPAHRRCSEEQPLLAATASGRGRREGEGADGVDADDDGDKPRRTAWRGWGSSTFRTAAACPAMKLLPLLALRGCLAACRCFCGALCYPCRFCLSGEAGADVSGSSSGGGAAAGGSFSSSRRRRRRGLGPYLLGCATQPERRLLWLSLGIMAYSLGLIMSVQGLLETLHALRNLLLRGLWAIAGLEGVFVALLAAGGVLELGLMVAAVSLGPKLQQVLEEERPSAHARRGAAAAAATMPPPTASSTDTAAGETTGGGIGGDDGGPSLMLSGTSSAPPGSLALSIGSLGRLQVPLLAAKGSGPANGLPSTAAAGSRSVSGGGASDWELHGIPHPHIHFPSTAAVAATAAAATAAATAAASAAASAAATAAAKVPWRTLALLAAVGYMEVAASLHLLGFGLALWVGVLGASEGCSAAVQGLYRIISFSPDVCLDLSMIGVPGPRCGGDLMQLCNIWRQLRLSGLLYGSLLIIAARLLLLIMATANYHTRHAVLLPLPHHHHHHHGHHHHHQHQHHRQQQQQSRHPPKNGGGGARGSPGRPSGSGWVELAGVGAGGSATADGGGRGGGGAGGGNRRHRATQRVQRKGSGLAPVGGPVAATDGDGEAEGIGGDVLHWQYQHQQQEPRRRTRRRDGGGGMAAAVSGDEPAATTGTVMDGDVSIGGGGGGSVTSTSRVAAAVTATSSGRRMRGSSAIAGVGATGIGGGGPAASSATAGDAGGGGGGVAGGTLPVSTPAGPAGGGSGGSLVVLELGSMGSPAKVLSAAGGSVGGGGGGGSSLGGGSGKGRRWGLFGF